MDFLDKSGHIFNLPSYKYEPIGYEFEENDYVFWVDDPNTKYLAVNNYYIKCINFIVYYDCPPVITKGSRNSNRVNKLTFDDIVKINTVYRKSKSNTTSLVVVLRVVFGVIVIFAIIFIVRIYINKKNVASDNGHDSQYRLPVGKK